MEEAKVIHYLCLLGPDTLVFNTVSSKTGKSMHAKTVIVIK